MNPHELRKLKNKAPLANVVLLIASIVIPYFYLEPQIERENDISASFDKEISDSIQFIKQAKVARVRADRASKVYGSVNEIVGYLPARKSLPEVIDAFYDLANKSGLFVTDVKYEMSKGEKKFNVPSFLIKFTLKAKYDELRKFLAGLEKMNKYPLIIQEIVASSGGTYSISIRQLVKS